MQMRCLVILLLYHLVQGNPTQGTTTKDPVINLLRPAKALKPADEHIDAPDPDLDHSEGHPTGTEIPGGDEFGSEVTDIPGQETDGKADPDAFDELSESFMSDTTGASNQQVVAFGFLFAVLLVVVWCVNKFVVSEHGNGVINL